MYGCRYIHMDLYNMHIYVICLYARKYLCTCIFVCIHYVYITFVYMCVIVCVVLHLDVFMFVHICLCVLYGMCMGFMYYMYELYVLKCVFVCCMLYVYCMYGLCKWYMLISSGAYGAQHKTPRAFSNSSASLS